MVKINFHSFHIGDVEDPELYASFPLYEFMQTPKGKWIKEHCGDPKFRTTVDQGMWGYQVQVYGAVEDKLATEYFLRWGDV